MQERAETSLFNKILSWHCDCRLCDDAGPVSDPCSSRLDRKADFIYRNSLITKGYRVEKRFIPLNSRPICFFCGNCERPFTFGDGEEEGLDRQRSMFCHCHVR